MGTGLDILIIENFVIEKTSQNKREINDYKKLFDQD